VLVAFRSSVGNSTRATESNQHRQSKQKKRYQFHCVVVTIEIGDDLTCERDVWLFNSTILTQLEIIILKLLTKIGSGARNFASKTPFLTPLFSILVISVPLNNKLSVSSQMWTARVKDSVNRLAYETGVKSSQEYFLRKGDIETDLLVHRHRNEIEQITTQTRKLQKLDKADIRILQIKIGRLEAKINIDKKIFKKTHADESKGLIKQPSSKTIAEGIWTQNRELDILRNQLHLCTNNVEFVGNTAFLRKHQAKVHAQAHVGKLAAKGCAPNSRIQYEKDLMSSEMYREDISEQLDEIFDDDKYAGEGEEQDSKNKFLTNLYVELLGVSETSALVLNSDCPPLSQQRQQTTSGMLPDLSGSVVPQGNHGHSQSIDDEIIKRLAALKVCVEPPNE